MSRFRKLSQTIWHCQYHIVWVPKYRFRILSGKVANEVENCIRAFSEQLGCEIIEMNIQIDHVHLIVMIPPKVSISGYAGTVKGRTAIRVFNRFRKLKEKPYWDNHFWARGYFATHGSMRGGELAITAFYHALNIVKNAIVLGTFGCRGQVNQKIIDGLMDKSEHRGWALEAQSAAGHPDENDLADGRDWTDKMMIKARAK